MATTFITGAQRTEGLIAPATAGDHVLVHLKGPGVFVCASITKQGGSGGLTFFSLDLDGRNVASLSFEAAANSGLLQANPFGIVLLNASSLSTVTIGYPLPLRYEKELSLKVTVNATGVAQIVAQVLHGTA